MGKKGAHHWPTRHVRSSLIGWWSSVGFVKFVIKGGDFIGFGRDLLISVEREKNIAKMRQSHGYLTRILVQIKGTFKWSKNLPKRGWKRWFLDGLGLLSLKLSHPSLELTSSGLQLSELSPTGSFISRMAASQSVLDSPRLKLPFNR